MGEHREFSLVDQWLRRARTGPPRRFLAALWRRLLRDRTMAGNKRSRKDDQAGKKVRKLYVEFDPDARREYVTGMHKRKQQRKEKAISDLKKQVEKERKEARDERRAALRERHEQQIDQKKRRQEALEEDSDDDEESDDERPKGADMSAQDMVSQLTGQKAKVIEEKVDDDFSKNMFGSSMVTVTTTMLGDDEEDDAEDEAHLSAKDYAASKVAKEAVQLLGEKNLEHTAGKAERMLQRLQHKKLRRAQLKAKVGSKAKLSAIIKSKGKKPKGKKKGKTSAKERRRRV